MKLKFFRFIAIFLLLISCSQARVPNTANPSELKIGTPLPTVDINAIEPQVSNTDYLKGCKDLNSSVYNEQVIYKDIIPGKTTSLEVKSLMGDPIRVLIDQWTYPAYIVIFEGEVVSTVSVSGYIDPFPLLSETIDIYGCPNIIFAYHLADDPVSEIPGTLGMVTFVYSDIGVVYVINHYPVRLTDRVTEASYFVPMTLHDYIYSIRHYFEYTDVIKLVSWDEAVEK